MENTLKQAIEANNIPAIREALVDIIVNDSGKIVPIETVTEVIETVPGIFDVDNGKKYPGNPAEMSGATVDQLISDLKSNFSPEKFKLLIEVCVLNGGRKPEDKTETVSSQETTFEKTSAKKCKCDCGKIINISIMALGAAAAIVGLCVPVKFLLGLGIGVFMLGTALLYMQITRN